MSIDEIKTRDLTTTTTTGEKEVTAKLAGSAETDAMQPLNAYLKSIHEAAIAAKLAVAIDIRDLDFMNSSSFKAFVTWLRILQETPSPDQYRVRILSDAKKHWQSRSLDALVNFAGDLVHVDAT